MAVPMAETIFRILLFLVILTSLCNSDDYKYDDYNYNEYNYNEYNYNEYNNENYDYSQELNDYYGQQNIIAPAPAPTPILPPFIPSSPTPLPPMPPPGNYIFVS